MPVPEITVADLKAKLSGSAAPLLLDVRENDERAQFSIGGLHIPLGQLGARIGEVPKDKELVVYCHAGGRSAMAVTQLQSAGYTKTFNLKGGMVAWQRG